MERIRCIHCQEWFTTERDAGQYCINCQHTCDKCVVRVERKCIFCQAVGCAHSIMTYSNQSICEPCIKTFYVKIQELYFL